MSRIQWLVHDNDNHAVYAVAMGWDRPLQAFFIDVIQADDPDGPPLLDLWPGCPTIKTVPELVAWIESKGQFMRMIPGEALRTLERHKRHNAGNMLVGLPDLVLSNGEAAERSA